MTRWEYKTVQLATSLFAEGLLDTEAFDRILNELGAQGWELTAAFDTNRFGGRSQAAIAVFRRPRTG